MSVCLFVCLFTCLFVLSVCLPLCLFVHLFVCVQFVTNWFKIVLGAREEEGIDFWWLDWQQGEDWIKVPGVNPTFWLNHIFFTNPYHWQNNTVRIINKQHITSDVPIIIYFS